MGLKVETGNSADQGLGTLSLPGLFSYQLQAPFLGTQPMSLLMSE